MRPRSDSLRLGRVNLRPEKVYLRPLMSDLRPVIANLRLGRVNFRSERAWEGQFHTLGFFGWGGGRWRDKKFPCMKSLIIGRCRKIRKSSILDAFGAAAPKGQCPMKHRDKFPYVCLSI